ncbi:MAG: hypothetical protein V2J26_04115 [Pacificimonas sp.]|jgi:hypothetical protein|nr:hypothetical protein [Pacificimonas sp.]
MTSFDILPGKVLREAGKNGVDPWADFKGKAEIIDFYKDYSSAEGWLGETRLAIWSREEVHEFRVANDGTYDPKYWFFGSDGCGTQFGLFVDETGEAVYVGAPDIGENEDIVVLGSWADFFSRIQAANYI